MDQKYCDQCENHCPVDALRCNRGRAHFGMEPRERKTPAGPAGLLEKCGFVLHHSGIDPAETMTALSAQEQAELERLLSILLEDWQGRMPEGMPGPRHGHH